jgi:hypothetical protein
MFAPALHSSHPTETTYYHTLPRNYQANEHHERGQLTTHTTRHLYCTPRHVNPLLPCSRAAPQANFAARAHLQTPSFSLACPIPDLETDHQHSEPTSRLEALSSCACAVDGSGFSKDWNGAAAVRLSILSCRRVLVVGSCCEIDMVRGVVGHSECVGFDA